MFLKELKTEGQPTQLSDIFLMVEYILMQQLIVLYQGLVLNAVAQVEIEMRGAANIVVAMVGYLW